jgi:hypothetical protein
VVCYAFKTASTKLDNERRVGMTTEEENTGKFFFLFVYVFDGLECVGHSFAYVAHLVFLGDVWIRTQRAAVASRCATNLATPSPS